VGSGRSCVEAQIRIGYVLFNRLHSERIGIEGTKDSGIENFDAKAQRRKDTRNSFASLRLCVENITNNLDRIRFLDTLLGVCYPQQYQSHHKEEHQRQQRLAVRAGSRDDDAEQQRAHPRGSAL
jgi:hypothetical protein